MDVRLGRSGRGRTREWFGANVAEAPLAPKPEVVVQKKQEEIEKPDENQQKEDPRPQQEAIQEQAAAAQQAKAPPPIEAPPAEKAAAPAKGVSSKPTEATLSWQKAVALHLSKHKRYPGAARDKRQEGVVTVWISIDRSGKVISSHLIASSGSELLDKEATEVLARASPLPRPPSKITELAYDFTLPIRFRIPK